MHWANQYALPAYAGEFADKARGRNASSQVSRAGTRRRGSNINAGKADHASYPTRNADLTTTLGIYHLNPIAVQTTRSSRTGAEIRSRSLEYRYALEAGTGQTAPVIGRVMIIKDMAPRGQLPVATDMLSVDSVFGMLDNEYTGRFKVLMDHTHVISGDGDDLTGSLPAVFRQGKIPVKGVARWEPTNTDGAIGDMLTGALYLCYVADTADVGANVPVLNFAGIYHFSD